MLVFQASAEVSRDFIDKDDLEDCRQENPAAADVLARATHAVIDSQTVAKRYGLAVPADAARLYGNVMPLFEQGLALDPVLYAKLNADRSSWE
ncbi:hypothetical protein ACQP2T_14940 [Nonomuraea sp. CA-143628]|uniref:hypothetical protein n=1 Tax=Nonomuraea sp. CA-143628 TaxID=3239997 RepID=UPI003D93181E